LDLRLTTRFAFRVSRFEKGKKMQSRLREVYEKQIVPELKKEFGYANDLQVPRLDKIVLNMGVGDAVADKKKLDSAVVDLTAIAAQKPVVTKAKKSIATYRLRQGQAIGTKVTLRGKRMYDFLDKLITVALPRVKDFHGLSKSKFDGQGNYAFGIKEHLIFPEISVDKIESIRGMDIVIATTAKTDDEARALLTKLGLPLVLK
jgi:large subunit ribosomal protein L5